MTAWHRTLPLREFLGDFYNDHPQTIWTMMNTVEHQTQTQSYMWVKEHGKKPRRVDVTVVYDQT